MKTLKNIILLIMPLTFFISSIISAQEAKQFDKNPWPIGGMEAIIKNVVYPKDAKEAKIEGKVILFVTIDEKGNVENVKVEKGVDKLLDEAAEKAIRKTKFTPGELNGEKIKCSITIPVLFKLS